MKSVFKTLCLFVAVLFFTGYLAYTAVAIDVKPVEDFAVIKKGVTFQKLSWSKNDKVTGYKIYQKNAKNNNYTLIKTIKSNKNNSCKIAGLNMESFYSFKISAFTSAFGREFEGKISDAISTCTMPRGEDIESIVEQTPKTFTVSWSRAINCDGYELEYDTDETLSDPTVHIANGINTTVCKIDGLELGETYYFRLRSFMDFEGEKLYSEYSEVYSATIKNIITPQEIDPSRPVVALTFDDGPSLNNASESILNTLEKYGVRATFFVVGENAEKNAQNIKRKAELGFEIGNHTYSHKHYGKDVTKQEIVKCSNIIEKITGSRPTVFRATGGITNANIKKICKKQGMSLYYWTIDTEDWKSKNAKKVLKEALKAQDGDIILMHDIYPSTAKAVKKLIPKLINRGYQFVTVSELVKYKSESAPKPGVQYLDGDTIKYTSN